jgi:curved DNA-binding protein CbpA
MRMSRKITLFFVAIYNAEAFISVSNNFIMPSPRSTQLKININSNDPFEVLDLEPRPNLDKRDIKRAYKRMAIKYHPDMVTNSTSTTEEKRIAGEVFSKINWAYEVLSGKSKGTTVGNAGTASSTKNYQRQEYQPPHRRTKAYSQANPSTDWRDYMPKDDGDDYDAGDDNFGRIFSDLFAGVSSGVASGGNFFLRDFVEFLEGNVDGFSRDDKDSELSRLLMIGSLDEVGNEMDDTDLVVQQLSSKLDMIDKEIIMKQAELDVATRYSERLDLSEAVAELEARTKVIKGYMEKARKRLVSLQSRYKQLIVEGGNDSRVSGKSRSSTFPTESKRSNTQTSEPPSTTTTTTDSSKNQNNWKTESFSSSSRRGSSRRRERHDTKDATSPPQSQYSSNVASDSSVPPHRRTASSVPNDNAYNRKKIVDEEFEKLKRDLGL